MLMLLYGITTCSLTKHTGKNLDGNYTRMLRAILNKSWRQHPTKQQLYNPLPPIMKNIQIRLTIHAGHSLTSNDELISNILLWTPSHGRAKAGRPDRSYIQQLCADSVVWRDDVDDIYCHPRRDCFVVSQLFSVARYMRRFKPGPKPT